MKSRASETMPTDVYLSFVSSLFANRQTLFTGMIVHIISFLIVYGRSGDPFYLYVCGACIVLSAYRIVSFMRFDAADSARFSHEDIARWERIYLYGGVTATTILGTASGYAIYALHDSISELICVSVTMASMVSVVGRNYGSAKAVDLQTMTAGLPIFIGCVARGELYSSLLSLMLLPLVITTRQMAHGIRDVLSNNVMASREIAQIAADFDIALSNMTHGLLMLDSDRRILVINQKGRELLRLAQEGRLKGRDLEQVLQGNNSAGDDGWQQLSDRLMQLARGIEQRALIEVSPELILEFCASRRAEGGTVLIFEDVTKRVQSDRKILHMVRFDGMTGLANRHYFQELLKVRLSGLEDERLVGLMLLDINDFKHVNDMNGHAVGDRLLGLVGERLQALAGPKPLLAHMIGDRFVLAFDEADGEDAAALEARMRAIFDACGGCYDVNGTRLRVGFNAGALIVRKADFPTDEWQIRCDIALYESKAGGQGRMTLFVAEMDVRYLETQRLKADLRQAVEAGALEVVYQPMISPDGRKLACCEALSRWTHPIKGPIPPNIFIDIAEEIGLITQITGAVLQRACADCVAWPEPIGVSVNISDADLRAGDLADRVRQVLAETGLAPARLHLEVTERSLVEEVELSCKELEELRALGVKIAIDDFGTGFSSLSYLDSLPIDIVKVDRSFVRDITGDGRRLKLLEGVVSILRDLDLQVVVEGIEMEAQLTLLNERRLTDLVQGYIFSKPVPAEQIAPLWTKLRKRKASAA